MVFVVVVVSDGLDMARRKVSVRVLKDGKIGWLGGEECERR